MHIKQLLENAVADFQNAHVPDNWNEISDEPCPNCQGAMFVGEQACAGICTKCYYESHETE